ncbi:lipoprotein signal peptidase [Methylocella silvestris BL2]|uniref:Lipoprotein signal peptidase n=1 Tax=Methylocella silvestris (strain DSM 15510 / CIP 108128 / LMG 27833 / NCIMB 13906 / BL2) TaxID=395965 RepID=LSPA_METSB|nr:signal peptidase II [Methylocella silvestris]B8ETD6.1 RecName: Full=Lipoprotein signal peptidase; AltName: Full=Prolipoprotein signal peptidase; AltName: Full=Signal peptidase II; Short=SPase II [Methylocella silvestris BL2]ACK51778.1 lipoprotein signal peptidase [Methylocella silvestris BL2]
MSPRVLGALVAALTLAADQANKLWLIFVYGIEQRQPIALAPFLDVVYAKNPGISYSLLSARTDFQRYALLGLTLAATIFMILWLWRSTSKLIACALGLIIGGALGNAYDRAAYGFVADFYHFHVGSFSWYVFNLADAAIVAGVALLLYDSLFSARGAGTGGKSRGEGASAL